MDFNRYQRQMLLPIIGEEGQNLLAKSSVLLIGAGGLGSAIAPILVGAGVGNMLIVDGDKVEVNNLHRQLYYTEYELGKWKSDCLVTRLSRLNSSVSLRFSTIRLDSTNVAECCIGYDLVIDATDNLSTRILLANHCQANSIPYLFGAVGGLNGFVSLFSTPNSKTSFNDFLSHFNFSMNEEDKSILGSVTQVVGGVMAHETIRYIVGCDDLLIDKLWCIDMLTMETYIIGNFKRLD